MYVSLRFQMEDEHNQTAQIVQIEPCKLRPEQVKEY